MDQKEKPARVLVVEDSLSMSALYCDLLEKAGYETVSVSTGRDALEQLGHSQTSFDVMLLDLRLPDMSGIDIMAKMEGMTISGHKPAVVVMTAHGSVRAAVGAMSRGAVDFILKPFSDDTLALTMEKALLKSGHATSLHAAQGYSAASHTQPSAALYGKSSQGLSAVQDGHFHGFIGMSPAMQQIYRTIERVGPSQATVFITGETGTGKELCAQAIHQQSTRADRPFIAVNCAAIPRELMESEIFGHVKGAFTGALSDRKGAAAQAEGGTLFLDEVTEMDTALQSKLLRFVQTSTYRKVGGSQLEQADIRIVCATNRDPLVEVQDGRLREDLFYRLYVIPIQMPPLRERGDDIMIIARALLQQYAHEENKSFIDFADDVRALLQRGHWPGNVRQLQNVIRNIVVLNEGQMVTQDMLPPDFRALCMGSALGVGAVDTTDRALVELPMRASDIRPLNVYEREMIERAIDLCGGNIPKAARRLEVSPSTIYRKKHGWQNRDASA